MTALRSVLVLLRKQLCVFGALAKLSYTVVARLTSDLLENIPIGLRCSWLLLNLACRFKLSFLLSLLVLALLSVRSILEVITSLICMVRCLVLWVSRHVSVLIGAWLT